MKKMNKHSFKIGDLVEIVNTAYKDDYKDTVLEIIDIDEDLDSKPEYRTPFFTLAITWQDGGEVDGSYISEDWEVGDFVKISE